MSNVNFPVLCAFDEYFDEFFEELFDELKILQPVLLYFADILREHIRATHEQRKFSCPMCNHRSSYKNNLEKHIKNVHSSAKSSNNASSAIMQQQPQTGQPLVQPQQPQQPQDTQSLELVALTPGPPQPQVQILQAPLHAPALC